MRSLNRVWKVAAWPAQAAAFAGRLGVPPLVGALLIGRGLDLDTAAAFMRPQPAHLHDPYGLPDMDRAVDRLLRAMRDDERVLVWGDYDVDGVAATCLLMEALLQAGARHVDYHIPHRIQEGYGLHGPTLEGWARQGTSLVVTVDCGVHDHQVLTQAAAWGMDVIVTDHHPCPSRLPPAVAVVSARRGDSRYRFPDLAGAGIAFKVVQGLAAHVPGVDPETALDLAALGTIADVVPLVGENRVLAKLGLERLSQVRRPGLDALAQIAGIRGALDAAGVAYGLAPRLNAAGRVARADAAVHLLRTQQAAEAAGLAKELDQCNQLRQQMEEAVLSDVRRVLPDGDDRRVLVLSGCGWHPGVLGIVASRLVDAYWRPVVLVGLEDGVGRGSARSIPGFDIGEALEACQAHLTRFGGHAMAAGVSVAAGALDDLNDALNRFASAAPPGLFLPVLDIDAEVSLGDLSLSLLEALEGLSPCGAANPQPLLMVRDVQVERMRRLGQHGQHLGFDVRDRQGRCVPAVAFRVGSRGGWEGRLDLAFRPELDQWRSTKRVRLLVEDWRPAGDGGPGEDLHAAISTLEGTRPQSSTLSRVEVVTPPPLNDGRGRDCRAVVEEVSGGAVLVWALHPGQARELTGHLRSRGRDVQYYDAGLPVAYRRYIEESFEQGALPTLVSPDPGEWWPVRPSTVVWCTPAPTPARFFSRSARAARVVLAYGAVEVADALNYWRAMALDREVLVRLYRTLGNLEKRLQRPVPVESVRGEVEKEFPGSGWVLVELGLKVFAELRLAAVERVDGAESVIMLPAPAQRPELDQSPTYARRRQEWSEAVVSVSVALEESVDTYRRWLEKAMGEG
ncbi:MAG TPA: single-stranded-DNA-specific exonuclease RecJ [Clostridiales bacterium UBA8153]|nr:single-stranded-DNA-specific exonuclease RecJ [Clostridiales bacterium UBA8153]